MATSRGNPYFYLRISEAQDAEARELKEATDTPVSTIFRTILFESGVPLAQLYKAAAAAKLRREVG